MKSIAVLIPSYKPGLYLDECFKCLEEQTLDKVNFTVYIALNGEKDFYEDFVSNLLRKYTFRYQYFHLDKAGVSNARNHLLNQTKEEFVTFLDDDDLISDNYLKSLLVNASERFMSVSNVKNFKGDLSNESDNYIGKCFKKIDSTETSKLKSRQFYSSPCAKCIHRKMIGDVKFDCGLALGEDGLFMAQISKNIDGVNKSDISSFYYVRLREGSATRSQLNKRKEFNRIIYLLSVYFRLMFSRDFDSIFIATRIVATFLKFKRLLINQA